MDKHSQDINEVSKSTVPSEEVLLKLFEDSSTVLHLQRERNWDVFKFASAGITVLASAELFTSSAPKRYLIFFILVITLLACVYQWQNYKKYDREKKRRSKIMKHLKVSPEISGVSTSYRQGSFLRGSFIFILVQLSIGLAAVMAVMFSS